MYCTDELFLISRLWLERNGINENPEYQRESAIWSIEKQQLFIDSLLNRFDIPKMYFHDLRPENGLFEYAVVDGKQRLQTIFRFLKDEFPLAGDFRLFVEDKGHKAPESGSYFSGFSDHWKEKFKGTSLTVALIHNATDEDIDELFSRLNNGEPLNAAEKRNAIGGNMCQLIRECSKLKFFSERLSVPNNRYQHMEIAAKFLLIEMTQMRGGGHITDLKKRFLDDMVVKNKTLSAAEKTGLLRRVTDQTNMLSKVFSKHDPLLRKQAYPPLYYIFIKRIFSEYGDTNLYTKLHKFIENFQAKRIIELEKNEDDRDINLLEFGRLMQQGTNDLGGLSERVDILTRYFLLDYPDIQVKDVQRLFNDQERVAIWILGGKKCANCGKEIELDEMQADHHTQWAYGGKTSLKNGRCLCGNCNAILAQKVH